MKVLISNVGSTSFKSKFFDMETEAVKASASVERVGSEASRLRFQSVGKNLIEFNKPVPDHTQAIRMVLELLPDQELGCISSLNEIDAIGFKAVHAGNFRGPAIIDDAVISMMEKFNDAAPSHNPPYLAAMRSFREILPNTPQVAAFETAFHVNIPDYAYIYSVPYEWYEDYDVRRYGFHGASLRYVSERVRDLVGTKDDQMRLVACHLGGSSSICAVRNGVSIDTSMGFTPQAGVPMSTRCGDIDPFIFPYMMESTGLGKEEISNLLTKRGGLLGISGVSADVRDLEKAAEEGHQRALLALNAFAYGVKKYIGAYAAALGGIDVLTFSGGIGENASIMRARICSGLEFLGIYIDFEKNSRFSGRELCISKEGAAVQVWVVPTNEELIVARETARIIKARNL